MLVNDTRPSEINQRLEAFVAEVLPRCQVAAPDAESWAAHPSGPYKLFGFRAPVLITEGEPQVIVTYCPELIAQQTDHLDAGQLDDYLDGVEFLLGRLAQYVVAGDEVDVAVSKAENEFHEKAPHMMSFMTDVWLRAMTEED